MLNSMIPSTMHAVTIDAPGPTGRLRLGTFPIPTPSADEVLIRVAYAGVNRADVFQRQGTYQPPIGSPEYPGLEVSGVIVSKSETINADSHRFQIGDKVCALIAGGGYAEYVSVPMSQCLPIPANVSLRDAASLPEAYATVWMALAETAKLQPHESLLVHGGASGIGVAAIQFAKTQHNTVYATAGSEAKCGLCHSLGAHAVNYRAQDFVQMIKDATDGAGVDVVLDMVGGDYFSRNLKCLKKNGRMVSIAFLRGATHEVNMGGLLMKNLSWYGVTLRGRSEAEKAHYMAKLEEILWPKLANGSIKPVIDHVFRLEEAQKAHERMEESLNLGKILLEVTPE